MTRPDLLKMGMMNPPTIHKYERYLPTAFDESLSLLEKVNKTICYMNEIGELTNEMLEKWNEVYEWLMNEGLENEVGEKLDAWYADGTLQEIINEKIFNDLRKKTEKLINAYEFGVTGESSGNDTQALQAAIDSTSQRVIDSNNIDFKGGTIELPAGVYVTNGLFFKSRVKIKGAGRGKTIIKLADGANHNVLTVPEDAFGCELEALTIDGNSQHNTKGHGLYLEENPIEYELIGFFDLYKQFVDKSLEGHTPYSNFRCRDVEIVNCAGDGLHAKFSNYVCVYENLYLFGNKGHGIYNESTDVIFTNIFSETNGKSGVFEAGSNNKWSNVKVLWNGKLSQTDGAFHVTSRRCAFTNIETQDNHMDGFKFVGAQAATLINCYADSNGKNPTNTGSLRTASGFRFENCRDIQAKNCIVDDYTLAPMADGYYATEYPYYIDVACTNLDLDIKVIGNTNKNSVINESNSILSSDLISYRNSTETMDGKTFTGSDPIITRTGLKVTKNEELLLTGDTIWGHQVTFAADIVLNDITGNTRLFQTSSDHFSIVIQNKTDEKSIGVIFRTYGDKIIDAYIPNLDFDYLLNKPIRLYAKANIAQAGGARIFITLSYMDAAGKLKELGTEHTITTVTNDDLLFMNYLRINPNTSNAMLIKELIISKTGFKQMPRIGEDLKRYALDMPQYYIDATSYQRKNVNTISFLPVASAFYKGMEMWVDGGSDTADKLYRCMKAADGSYSWKVIAEG